MNHIFIWRPGSTKNKLCVSIPHICHFFYTGRIFVNHMTPCHFGCFLAILGPPGPGITPGWGTKMSNISSPIAWGVFWHINLFPGWFFHSIWRHVILAVFWPFLGPPGPGITPGWGFKVPNISFSIAWGVLRHINQFPGWFFHSLWRLVILAVFRPFLVAPRPGTGPEEGLNDLNPSCYMYKEVPGSFRV